jgi:hypothetical protein
VRQAMRESALDCGLPRARWSSVMGIVSRSGIGLAVAFTALAVLSGTASATPRLVEPRALLRMAILNLPLNGMLLLLLYWLPTFWGSPPGPQPVARHVLLMLGCLGALTLGGALASVVAFYHGNPGTLSFTVGAVGMLLLYCALAVRYLGRGMRDAAITGGVLALVDVGTWALLISVAVRSGIGALTALMSRLLPVLLLLLLVLLGTETYLFHVKAARRAGTHQVRPIALPPTLWRTAEVWVVGAVLAAVVLLADWTMG